MSAPTVHRLPATPDAVQVGVIDPRKACVLSIDSGDELELQTLQLWGDAVHPGSTYEDVAELRARHRGKGPHSVTGPVEVRHARAGMVLRVDILSYRLAAHGFNLLLPRGVGRGLLKDDFEGGQVRHFTLDRERMTTRLGPATVFLRPFLGIMGVAPPGDEVRISSVPGVFGGNMDCSELVEGSTLFLPIWVDGAGFYAGDAHAAQGCGELNQTALESAMEEVRLRLTLADEPPLARPRIETPTHIITMGFDPDLMEAARQATRDMIDWMVRVHRMDPQDAYVLCSLQVDLVITQLVNGHNGVHAKLDRRVFEGAA